MTRKVAVEVEIGREHSGRYIHVYCKYYVPLLTCLCPQYIAEKKKMAERITEELPFIQEELGGIPESFFLNALKETGDEDAKDLLRWFSEQGQYNCVCILLPSTTPDT